MSSGDMIHPTALGNKKIANNLLSYMNVPLINYNPKSATDAAPATIQYKTNLTSMKIKVNYGVTTPIYKLGLTSGYPNGVVTLFITGTREGGVNAVQKRCQFVIANTTVVNRVTEYGGLSTGTVTLFEYHRASQPVATDFTVTMGFVDNQLQLSITPNTETANMDFYIEGEAVLTVNSVVGQVVYENA
jgi:hypothetical protein